MTAWRLLGLNAGLAAVTLAALRAATGRGFHGLLQLGWTLLAAALLTAAVTLPALACGRLLRRSGGEPACRLAAAALMLLLCLLMAVQTVAAD